MITKKGPKPVKDTRPVNQICSDEVNEILKKYNCDIHCHPQYLHGQTLYIPIIVELPKPEPQK